MDRMGRRVLLLLPTFVMTVSLAAVGAFYIIAQRAVPAGWEWLPLVSLSIYCCAFSIGIGTVSWVILSEINSYDAKPIVVPIGNALCSGTSFFTTYFFNILVVSIGMGPTFLAFTIFCIFSGIFCYFLVPETKQKSFLEIQKMLTKSTLNVTQ